jgi:hypothetical protein
MRIVAYALTLGVISLAPPSAKAACSWSTLTNGTTANATQVMNNFDCLAPQSSPVFTGNVGINVASPAYRLQVNAGTNQNIALLGTVHMSSGATIQSVNDSYSALEKLEFRASQFAVMDGNVGIGVVNPGYKLQINAGANQNLAILGAVNLSTGVTIQSVNDAYSALLPIEFRASWYTFSSGRVGIGTANPNQSLDVIGTIRQSNCTTAGTLSVNGNGDIVCSSDARLKNIRGSYIGGLEVLSQLEPQRFTFRSSNSNPNETFEHVGFIAQNVRGVIPQAVAVQRDGFYSLETTAILAASVNAINELRARNDLQAAQLLRLIQLTTQQAREHASLSARLVALERERAAARSSSGGKRERI